MHEEILATILRRNEAVAFLSTEPFNHTLVTRTAHRTFAPVKTVSLRNVRRFARFFAHMDSVRLRRDGRGDGGAMP